MSFAYIAAGSALVSAYSIYEGSQAAKRSEKYASEASETQQQALDFSKQQYADWQETYGPIEKNLAEFYTNLTPDYIEAQGLQNVQQNYQRQREEMDKFFAQAGIESGAQADILAKMGMQRTREAAQVTADAPIKAAEAKSSFLSIGLGQKPGVTSGVTRALESKQSMLSGRADIAAGEAETAYGYAGEAAKAGTEAYIKSRIPTAASGKPTISGSGQHNYDLDEVDY